MEKSPKPITEREAQYNQPENGVIHAQTVEEALAVYLNDGVKQVILPDTNANGSSRTSYEFIATGNVQTIPDPNDPISEVLIDWLINGGDTPIDQSQIPESKLTPVLNNEGTMVFPGVVSELEDVPSQQRPFKEKVKKRIQSLRDHSPFRISDQPIFSRTAKRFSEGD